MSCIKYMLCTCKEKFGFWKPWMIKKKRRWIQWNSYRRDKMEGKVGKRENEKKIQVTRRMPHKLKLPRHI